MNKIFPHRFLAATLYAGCAGFFFFSLVTAVKLRLDLPDEPFIWPDSLGYLSPGISLETTGTWVSNIRQFFYPLFLSTVTRVTGHTSSIATAQHVIGLASGLVFLAAWWRIISLMALRPWLHALALAIGVSGLHVFWVSPVVLLYECYVMPEGLFMAASSLGLLALANAVDTLTRPNASRRRVAVVLGLLAFVSTALYFIIPRWGFGVILVPSLAGLLAIALRHAKKVVFGGVASGYLAALLVFGIPEFMLSRHAPANASYFLPMALFGMHADFVREELHAESKKQKPLYDPAFLRRARDAIDHEFARSAQHPARNPPYPTLGYSPEEILFGDSVVAMVIAHFNNDPAKIKRFFFHFYYSAWYHQTHRLLDKIWGELRYCYSIPSGAFSVSAYNIPIEVMIAPSRDLAKQASQGLAPSMTWSGYSQRMSLPRTETTPLRHPPLAIKLEQIFADFFPYLSIFSVLAGLVIFSRRLMQGPIGRLGLAAFFFALPPFAAFLSIAFMHSLYPGRYRDTYFVFSLFSVLVAFLPALALIQAGLAKLEKRSSSLG